MTGGGGLFCFLENKHIAQRIYKMQSDMHFVQRSVRDYAECSGNVQLVEVYTFVKSMHVDQEMCTIHSSWTVHGMCKFYMKYGECEQWPVMYINQSAFITPNIYIPCTVYRKKPQRTLNGQSAFSIPLAFSCSTEGWLTGIYGNRIKLAWVGLQLTVRFALVQNCVEILMAGCCHRVTTG